jgi:hypothetical protein
LPAFWKAMPVVQRPVVGLVTARLPRRTLRVPATWIAAEAAIRSTKLNLFSRIALSFVMTTIASLSILGLSSVFDWNSTRLPLITTTQFCMPFLPGNDESVRTR